MSAALKSSNRKLVTAAVVTAAGVALLTAGGATFATWSNQTTLAEKPTISSGELSLTAHDDVTWTNSQDQTVTEAVEDGTYEIVPGDSLTFSQSVELHAAGDLLNATLMTNVDSLEVTGGDAGLAAALEQASDFTVATANGASTTYPTLSMPVTEANDGDRLTVTLTFDFTDVSGTAAQNETVNFGALEVRVAQGYTAGQA